MKTRLTIVWFTIRDERDAIVYAPSDVPLCRYDLQYASGKAAPHYPLPALRTHYKIGGAWEYILIGDRDSCTYWFADDASQHLQRDVGQWWSKNA